MAETLGCHIQINSSAETAAVVQLSGQPSSPTPPCTLCPVALSPSLSLSLALFFASLPIVIVVAVVGQNPNG